VNLSAREFQEGDVLSRLTDLVTQFGIDPCKLILEITETSYISDPEETMYLLRELKKLEIGLWLDDFGTGHSTVEHLLYFPVDALKIPETFVKGLPDGRAIRPSRARSSPSRTTSRCASSRRVVEQNAQLEFLRAENCDYIQGFLYSLPVTADQLHAVFSSFPSSGQ